MGQEIARVGGKYSILKKIKGTPHSVCDWSFHINNGSEVSENEAIDFMNSLSNISKFPQSSFDDYARQLKLYDDKSYKLDSINPNNLLVDYADKKIYIIDTFKKVDPSHVNTRYDLTSCLLDFSLFNNFYEKLNDEQKENMLNSSKTIIEKCKKGAEKFNILDNEKTYIKFLANVDKWFGFALVDKGGDYRSRYNSMKSILKN